MPEEKRSEEFIASTSGEPSGRVLVADVDTLTDRYGCFRAEPFKPGYGALLANSICSALLLIEVAAVTAVRIEGATHEPATIPGVVEDFTDVLRNIQQVSFRLHGSGPKTLRISRRGPGKVTAADIETDSDVKIVDPSVHIATLSESGSLNIEMHLKRGRRYVSAENNFDEGLGVGHIPISSDHMPIERCSYTVDPIPGGKYTDDFEQLTIEVWTNGSITAEEAISLAATSIREHSLIFTDVPESDEQNPAQWEFNDDPGLPESFDVLMRELQDLTLDVKHYNTRLDFQDEEISNEPVEHLERSVDEFPLSVRTYNALKNADIRTIRDLVQHTEEELSTTKNFGKKSIEEIREILQSLNLDFGMNPDIAIEDTDDDLISEFGRFDSKEVVVKQLELPDQLKPLLPALRIEMHEEATARKYVTERYRSLVDRKYATGLSTDETDELERLRVTLDAMDQPYYEAIITTLRNLIKQKEVSWPTLSDHLEAQQ